MNSRFFSAVAGIPTAEPQRPPSLPIRAPRPKTRVMSNHSLFRVVPTPAQHNRPHSPHHRRPRSRRKHRHQPPQRSHQLPHARPEPVDVTSSCRVRNRMLGLHARRRFMAVIGFAMIWIVSTSSLVQFDGDSLRPTTANAIARFMSAEKSRVAERICDFVARQLYHAPRPLNE